MAMSAKLNLLQPLTCNSDVSIWVKEDDKQQTNADLSLSFNLSQLSKPGSKESWNAAVYLG